MGVTVSPTAEFKVEFILRIYFMGKKRKSLSLMQKKKSVLV